MVSVEATRTTERHMARQAALSASDVFTGWSVPPLERAIRIDVVANLPAGCWTASDSRRDVAPRRYSSLGSNSSATPLMQ